MNEYAWRGPCRQCGHVWRPWGIVFTEPRRSVTGPTTCHAHMLLKQMQALTPLKIVIPVSAVVWLLALQKRNVRLGNVAVEFAKERLVTRVVAEQRRRLARPTRKRAFAAARRYVVVKKSSQKHQGGPLRAQLRSNTSRSTRSSITIQTEDQSKKSTR